MKKLITDDELTAYARGLMSPDESRTLERKAAQTGQADLLLAVAIAQDAIDKDLYRQYWGDDPLENLWEPAEKVSMVACKDPGYFKEDNGE